MTSRSRANELELIAVRDHAFLRGCRCGNSVSRLRRGCGARRGRCTGSHANSCNIDIGIKPEAAAVGADRGLVVTELRLREIVGGGNGGAGVALLDEVEFVAVGDHLGLGWRGRSDAVSGGRGGQLRRCERWRAAEDTDTDIHVSPHVCAGGADAWVVADELGARDPGVRSDGVAILVG